MTEELNKHRTAAELLPFYLNGSLSPEENELVEAALAQDEGLRRQRDLWRHIQAAMKGEADSYSPGAFGLARLRAELEAEGQPTSRPAVPIRPSKASSLLRIAAVAAISAVLGGALFQVLSGGDPVYRQAGGASGAGDLVLAFRPDAAQGEVSDLLLANEIVITDGPSALGLFRANLTGPGSLEEAVMVLRAQTGLVESADIAK